LSDGPQTTKLVDSFNQNRALLVSEDDLCLILGENWRVVYYVSSNSWWWNNESTKSSQFINIFPDPMWLVD